MKFTKLNLANVNHYTAHPTSHKLIIAATGAVIATVGAVLSKKLETTDQPSQ